MARISRAIPLSLLLLSTPALAAAQETFSFPTRAGDIPSDAIWAVDKFDEGDGLVQDFNVWRWNEGAGRWEKGSGGSANSANYDWGIPVYAPAGGFVVSCWRNFPDHPDTDTDHDRASEMFGGGNFLYILTGHGNGISINHLQSGSIPPELCPINAGSMAFPMNTDKEGGWRVDAYIEDSSDWPIVTEGQFIGRVGHNGNSGGPHLHMSSQPLISLAGAEGGRLEMGDWQPIRFRNVWGHDWDEDNRPASGDWYRWRGSSLFGDLSCPTCGTRAFLASPFLRRASDTAGDVKPALDTLFVSSDRMVTATIGQTDSRLKLIRWDLVGVDGLNRRASIADVAAKDIHLAEPASDIVLAAIRQTDDRLRMAAFRVNAFGTLSLVAEKTYGTISALDMAEIPGVNRKAVVAVRTAGGALKLIAFDVATTFAGGEVQTEIERLGEIDGESIGAVRIAHARGFTGVYAAIRRSNGRLRVIPYTLSSGGTGFSAGTAANAGGIGANFDVAPLAKGVAVSVQDSGGLLRTMTWKAGPDGDLDPARKATVVDFPVNQIRLMDTPHGASNVAGIVRNGAGDLELVAWAARDDGGGLRRIGSSVAGPVSGIAADVVSRSYPPNDPRDMIVTAMRDGDGELRLITWDTNLVDP